MKVALDLDDVLAGYVIGVHKVFNKPLIPHDHWDPNGDTANLILANKPGESVYNQKYLDHCENSEGFWRTLPVITHPSDIQFHVQAYITSSPANMIWVRQEWLRRYGFPDAPVVHSTNKAEAMRHLGCEVLIDDRLKTVRNVISSGLLAFQFVPWYGEGEPTDMKELGKRIRDAS